MSKSISNETKKVNLSSLDFEAEERLIDWVTFYRRNLNIFCKDYFNLKLYPFQEDILYHLGICDNTMVVAARAISKTWTLAVGASAICILYPNSEVVIVSSNISQAGIIVREKIDKELRDSSPNLIREIKEIKSSKQEYQILFHNGSSLIIVPALDSARGKIKILVIKIWCYNE